MRRFVIPSGFRDITRTLPLREYPHLRYWRVGAHEGVLCKAPGREELFMIQDHQESVLWRTSSLSPLFATTLWRVKKFTAGNVCIVKNNDDTRRLFMCHTGGAPGVLVVRLDKITEPHMVDDARHNITDIFGSNVLYDRLRALEKKLSEKEAIRSQ